MKKLSYGGHGTGITFFFEVAPIKKSERSDLKNIEATNKLFC